jgi:RHS repeat-associated protein
MKAGFRWSLISLTLLAALAHADTPDRVWTRTYNTQGLIDSLDGPRTDVNDVTHYTYDTQGHLATVTDALGGVTTFDTYDMYGHPGRIVDVNQVVTTIGYTAQGWPQTITRDSTGTPATTTLSYNASGDVTQTQDADGVVMNYTYDDARRLTDITDGLGNRIHYTLDAADNRTKEEIFDTTGTLKYTVSRTFNTLSQLLTVVDALNRTVLTYNYPDGYDAEGHPTHSADAQGVQRKQGYDALNRLTSAIDNYNGTDAATQNTQSTFAYDVSDNLEGVSDPDGLATVYDHDGLGNRTGLHSPDTGSSAFNYDAAGNLISSTDAKGITRTYSYDALNRLLTLSYSDSSLNAAYHYDEPNGVTGCGSSSYHGHLTSIVESAVTTVYCYDTRGNVVQKRQTQGSEVDVTGYGYTLADRLSSLTTPSQTVTQYSHDAVGRISGVTVTPANTAGQTAVSAIGYLPFGPISGYTLGNGQAITRSYDANYQLTDLTSPALNLHFSRDAMGNITAISNSNGASPVESYSYDPLYRLTAVNDASGTAIEAYTYSKTGDRLSKVKAGGLATGIYGYQSNTHWLTSIGSAARTYDLNGNTVGSANAGETLGYGYNGRNRLTLVQHNQQTVATYVYNAMGERVAKAVTSPQVINERFAYNEASQLIGEYGTTNRDYVWLGDLPVAVVDNGATNAVSYVHADGLGTPRAISDAAGNTVWQWTYQSNPFGEQQPTGSYVYNLRLPGQYFDVESGLFYNVSRSYDATSGRYLESDPIGLRGGISTYSYTYSSPLTYFDSMGTNPGVAALPFALDGGMPLALSPVGAVTAGAVGGYFIGSAIDDVYGDDISSWVWSATHQPFPRPKDMTSKEQSQYSRYCIGSNNPCASLKLATQKAIERAKEKMGNMLNDKTLYDNAYSTPNPGVTGTSTTWIGHVDDLNGRLGTIAALISLGQKMGCDMSAEILEAASLFVPLKPAGR